MVLFIAFVRMKNGEVKSFDRSLYLGGLKFPSHSHQKNQNETLPRGSKHHPILQRIPYKQLSLVSRQSQLFQETCHFSPRYTLSRSYSNQTGNSLLLASKRKKQVFISLISCLQIGVQKHHSQSVSPNALLSNFFTFFILCNSSQPLRYPHLYFRLCISLLSSKISGESHIRHLSPTMKSALSLRQV